MALTLQDLKQAMEPIADLGKGELTFDAGGKSITLRVLAPEEELQVQRYSRAALAEGEAQDQTTAMDYLDRFRSSTLSYSIVKIGDLDFRDVQFVETGEKLPSGIPVKIKKYDALLKLIQPWSRSMVTSVFRKYGELSSRVESELEKLISFEDIDFDAEIAALEEKLSDLRDAKARYELTLKDPRSESRNQVASSGPTRLAKTKSSPSPVTQDVTTFPSSESAVKEALVVSAVDASTVGVEVEDADPAPPSPVTPAAAAVVPATPPQARKSILQAQGVVATPQPSVLPTPTKVDPLSDVDSSFSDSDNQDALAAETQRIAARRAAAARGPLLSAKEAYKAAQIEDNATQDPVLSPSGKRDGVEVFKMPTQDLSNHQPPTRFRPPAQGGISPGFRPAK